MSLHRYKNYSVFATGFALVCLLTGGECPDIVPPPPPDEPCEGVPTGSNSIGTVVTIMEVCGGSPVTMGGPISATFMVEKQDGTPLAKADLNRFSIFVSGPTDGYQRVIPPQGNLDDNAVENPDGSITYTFPDGFPDVFAAPSNDSPDFGPADGEMTGMPTMPGTYTLGIEARFEEEVDGESVRRAGDAFFDFPVGGGAISSREVVLEANCEKCHNQLQLHGSNRLTVKGCVLCHVRGGEDRISADPAKATPDISIYFANLIHRLHRGRELPTVAATANSADPFRYTVIGFGENPHDFSDVGFPRLPGGVMDCDACHGGAAQGDLAFTKPSRLACRGCHDDIDWTAGTRLDHNNAMVDDGLLTKAQLTDPAFRSTFNGVTHTFNDTQCTLCHKAGAVGLDPAVVHVHETSTDKEGLGLAIEITNVTGQAGGGAFFQAGDFPSVTFKLTDAAGNGVPITNVDTVAMIVAGPTSLYQHVIPGEGSSRVRPWRSGSLRAAPSAWVDNFAVDGTYTYTFEDAGVSNTGSTAWPAVYPAARNSLTDGPPQEFPFADGWGQLYTAAGTPLDPGTYSVVAYAFRRTPSNNMVEGAIADTLDVLYGAAGAITPYAGTVVDAKCNECHEKLAVRAHGGARAGVRACLACHTPGAQDNAPVAGDDPANDNLDLRVVIHKIHNARELDVVANGGSYDLQHGGRKNYSMTLLPSMPGEAKTCTACHATDSWKDPPERTNMSSWMVACTSCHDSTAAAVHVQLNMLGVGQEACDTCHGVGMAFNVEESHRIP